MVRNPARWRWPMGRVPFVTTSPIDDLAWVIALLPVWWLLGLEQFMSPLVAILAAIKVLATRRAVAWNPVLTALVVFLVPVAISVLFVSESFRYVTYVRNGGMYLMAILVVFVVMQARDARQAQRTLFPAIAFALAAAAVLGILGITGVWRPRFDGAIGSFLPSALADTEYGARVIERRLGGGAWFAGLGGYFRVNGPFLYATMYAAAIAVAFPALLHVWRQARGLGRFAWTLVAGLVLVNLAYTTGRVGTIALIVGAIVWWVATWKPNKRHVRAVLLLTIAVLVGLLVPPETWSETIEATVLARGSGSVDDRATIYVETVRGWFERPWFGWGTERDIVGRSGFQFPAGSHSMILGALYRHGIVGLLAFFTVALVIAHQLRYVLTAASNRTGAAVERFEAMRAGAWTLAAATVISLTSVLDLDATAYIWTWTILAVALRAAREEARLRHPPHPEAGAA